MDPQRTGMHSLRRRFRLALPLALPLLGCAAKPDASHRATAPARLPPPAQRSEATAPPVMPSPDAWIVRADSVMRVALDRDLFLSAGGLPDGVQSCADDEASDQPPLQVAAVALRIVGRSPAVLDSATELSNILMRSTYRVEAASVATMVPQWIAKFVVDSGKGDERSYEGRIAARVDTFDIKVGQALAWFGDDSKWQAMPPGPHWVICDPDLPTAAAGESPGFWGFAHQAPRWMEVQSWRPADGSWARIVALADSARKETSGIRN